MRLRAPRLLARLGAALLPLLLCGCLQRVDAPLRLGQGVAGQGQKWTLAGSFGGDAVLSQDSPDPWEQRFADGGFKEVSGLCATGSEVYVCDLGISRLQVFDFDGRFLRSYGLGNPIKGTMLTLAEFYSDYKEHPRGAGFWETGAGSRWAANYKDLFVAADVYVVPEGYWLIDQARTRLTPSLRSPALTFYPWNGEPRRVSNPNLAIPGFLAGEGDMLAVSEPYANYVQFFNSTPQKDGQNRSIPSKGADAQQLAEAWVTLSKQPRYSEIIDRQTHASAATGEFRYPGGLAIRFGKLLVCDRGNRRLELFEARNKDAFYWCKLLKVILQESPSGLQRFEEPRDVDIGPDGTILVLDSKRSEVAVLSPSFDRLGSFGKGTLGDPWALDMSDDGKHCFVSDRSGNKVWHFVRGN